MAETKWKKLIGRWLDREELRDLPIQIDELRRACKRRGNVYSCMVLGGALFLGFGFTGYSHFNAAGLLLVIMGTLGMFFVKTCMHITLSMHYVVSEIQKQKNSHSG